MRTDQLLLFAKVSQITYDDPKESKKKFGDLGLNIVEYFNVDSATAYLLKDLDESFILSFRGTANNTDVKADLTAGKNYEIENGQSAGKVHVGFKQETDKLWPKISKSLYNVKSLYVTGHSLGAAMATIAARRMQSKVTALVTFGSPRVGDKDFVDGLKVLHYRVQNNCDDVTKVPPRLMGFRHHGMHKYMNYHGQFRNFNPWQQVKDMLLSRVAGWKDGEHFLGAKDHLMANYIAALEKPKDD